VENAAQAISAGRPFVIPIAGMGRNIAESTEIKEAGGRKINAPVRMNDLFSLSLSLARKDSIAPAADQSERKKSIIAVVSEEFSKRAIDSRSTKEIVSRTK
jgi:hypothetical protein